MSFSFSIIIGYKPNPQDGCRIAIFLQPYSILISYILTEFFFFVFSSIWYGGNHKSTEIVSCSQ